MKPAFSRHMLSDRRNFPRVSEADATAIIEGKRYQLEDWNPQGFMVAPYAGQLDVGAALNVTLIVPFADIMFRFVMKAAVVRRDDRSKQLAATFTTGDTETVKLLSQLASVKQWIFGEKETNE